MISEYGKNFTEAELVHSFVFFIIVTKLLLIKLFHMKRLLHFIPFPFFFFCSLHLNRTYYEKILNARCGLFSCTVVDQ